MSDRVAFIGGSTVGRDHFAWPVIDIDPSEAGAYPAVSLENALRWHWLVKRWSVTLAVNYLWSEDVEVSPGEFESVEHEATASASFEFGFASDGDVPIARESDLVRPPALSYFVGWTIGSAPTSTGIDDIANYTSANSGPIHIEVGLSFDPRRLRWFDDGLRIEIGAEIETNAQSGSTSASPDFNIDYTLEDAFVLDGARHVRDWNMSDNVDNSLITALSLDVEPLEYWPYANSGGSPVYNTATGAQLIDPLS